MEQIPPPSFKSGLEGRLQQFPHLAKVFADIDPKMVEFLYSLGFMDGHSWGRYEAFVASGKTLEEYFVKEYFSE